MSAPTTASTSAAGPTGEQYSISRGPYAATITEVAAALREFTVDGVDLTEPYSASATPPSGDGIVLAPWPNRVRDGRWLLDGVVQQLDITEVDLNNALHGLLRYSPYRLLERGEHYVVLGAGLFPQHGYPFRLETTVRYELVDDGLEVTHTAHNLSQTDAPVAFGTHPFLTIGDVPTELLTFTLNATTHFEVDARLNPIGQSPVDGTDFDLRAGRLVGELSLDDAFGGVQPIDGVSAILRAPDGREVRLKQDENHGYVQVYTTRTFPKRGGPALAIAVEPMTAPPDGFNSGLGLRWVKPGETWTVGWGIQYSS